MAALARDIAVAEDIVAVKDTVVAADIVVVEDIVAAQAGHSTTLRSPQAAVAALHPVVAVRMEHQQQVLNIADKPWNRRAWPHHI